MEYDQAARKRLGREVRAARTRAGYRNRDDFADLIGRSARQVQALENGESGVGPDTWAAAAEGLGWQLSRIYDLLDGVVEVRADRRGTSLSDFSDDELLAEVRRRMESLSATIHGIGGAGVDTAAAIRRRQALEAAQPVTQAAGTTSPRRPDPDPESQDDGTMEPS